ncbi:MarC family protein [Zhouia sp. PK063]|uniref:MarC family protein n=1 Tax=Zhouia sp. PK063 TaxID=3373602 RepID=UPI0037A1DF50
MELLKSIFSDTISVFTIMNPLSVGVIMLTLLDETVTKQEIKATAFKATKGTFVAMVVVFLIGQYIFKFLGISPDGLRVFGGIILLIMAVNMVQGHGKTVNHSTKEREAAEAREDISIVPLAIPITVGPGLATTLLNMSVAATTWQSYVSGISAIVICCIASYLILQRMPYIKEKLGVNGLRVFNRVMGLIVGSLAAQMILSGISKFL